MARSGFSEERFPARIAFGASGGPERRVEIVRLSTGFEHRNQRTAHAVRRYDAGSGVKSLADLADIVAFFEARRGRLVGFRFRDPLDWHSTAFGQPITAFDQMIGTGDGVTTRFSLVKRYGTDESAYERPIEKPVAGSLKIGLGWQERQGEGVPVTAGFAYDVPVRFDIDHLAVNVSAFEAGEIPTIPLIEIRP